MIINLTDTQSSEIAAALLRARRNLGNASGMVLTLLVAAEQRTYTKVYEAARVAAREHPSRLILVVNTGSRTTKMDAEIHLAEDVPGEVIVLSMSGDLREHADSAVLPLLLPDSPVVIWWPAACPAQPALDTLGRLASRRITDAAGDPSPLKALQLRAANHAPGDTDLAWTRLTLWRALLAAALDQHPTRVLSASVSAARQNAPADLMAAWLQARLGVEVTRKNSSGPGITSVSLETLGGPIVVARQDGSAASYSIPGQPQRVVALQRRDVNELLTEEIRRMDPDEIYEEALQTLLQRSKAGQAPQIPATQPDGPPRRRSRTTRPTSRSDRSAPAPAGSQPADSESGEP